MDIEGISDFVALAESRSFSKAAASRFVTQPAFSRRIQALEMKIGTALVNRSVTPIALTPAGERFLVYAHNLSDLMDKAQEDVQSEVTALANPVRVVSPHSLSITFFPHWYRNLQRKTPGLTMRLVAESASNCALGLRKGLADLAIILLADGVNPCFDLKDIQSRRLGKDSLIAVKAPHLAKDNRDLLAYSKDSYMDSCARAVIGMGKGIHLKTVFESKSGELLRAMALAGFGTAVLQESLIEDDLREGFLVPVFKNRLDCRILLLRSTQKIHSDAEAIWKRMSQQET